MVNRTTCNDPSNEGFDLNDLIGSLPGEIQQHPNRVEEVLISRDYQISVPVVGDGSNNGGGFNLQDIISQVSRSAQFSVLSTG